MITSGRVSSLSSLFPPAPIPPDFYANSMRLIRSWEECGASQHWEVLSFMRTDKAGTSSSTICISIHRDRNVGTYLVLVTIHCRHTICKYKYITRTSWFSPARTQPGLCTGCNKKLSHGFTFRQVRGGQYSGYWDHHKSNIITKCPNQRFQSEM